MWIVPVTHITTGHALLQLVRLIRFLHVLLTDIVPDAAAVNINWITALLLMLFPAISVSARQPAPMR